MQSILASLDSCNQASLLCTIQLPEQISPNQPIDILKKRIKGGKPQNSTRLTVSLSLFHKTFLTSTFDNDDFLKELRYYPTTYESETFKTDVPATEEEHIKFSLVFKRYITRQLPWKRAK